MYIQIAARHNQLSNVMYVGLAMMCLLCLGLVALFYMRSLKDKRRSQAAIRSLLDLMTETNRESQTSCAGIGGGHPISSFTYHSDYSVSSRGLDEGPTALPAYIQNKIKEYVQVNPKKN